MPHENVFADMILVFSISSLVRFLDKEDGACFHDQKVAQGGSIPHGLSQGQVSSGSPDHTLKKTFRTYFRLL